MEKVAIKTVATYAGHSINKNKTVSLTLKFKYDTITKYIQLIQMLNEDVSISAKLETGIVKLGTFMINSLTIDHDGEGKVKFNSQVDFVELNNLGLLIDTEMFKVSMDAEIESDEDGDAE